MPDNDMGKGKISKGGGSLTDDDWKQMAEKWGMSVKQAKANTLEMIKRHPD